MTWVYVALVALAVQLATLTVVAVLVRRALRAQLTPMLTLMQSPKTSTTGMTGQPIRSSDARL